METLHDELPDAVNYSLIEPGLYLGNLSTALDQPTLAALGVSHILTVTTEPLPPAPAGSPARASLFIQVYDMVEADLLSHFSEACRFIQAGQAEGGVLVHCYFGVSRSAALVAAFLMWQHHLQRDAAILRIKAARKCVGPNAGFMEQLALFGALDCCLDNLCSSNPVYRLYAYRRLLAIIRTEPHKLRMLLERHLDERSSSAGRPGLQCCRCRVTLCSKEDILHHMPGQPPQLRPSTTTFTTTTATTTTTTIADTTTTTDTTNCTTATDTSFTVTDVTAKEAQQMCSEGVFVAPQRWLLRGKAAVGHRMAGALLCYNCSTTLGTFHWLRGVSCPCGVAPDSCGNDPTALRFDPTRVITC